MTRPEIDRQINMEKIHDERTARAKNNIREMFSTGQRFGVLGTEKNKQNLEDMHPGVYKVFTEQKIEQRGEYENSREIFQQKSFAVQGAS